MTKFDDIIRRLQNQITTNKEDLADFEGGRREDFDLNDGRVNVTAEQISKLKAAIERDERLIMAYKKSNST